MRSHVSLTRLTVDTGVSPENLENRFGEFKMEANSLCETPVPGTTSNGEPKGGLTSTLQSAYGFRAL